MSFLCCTVGKTCAHYTDINWITHFAWKNFWGIMDYSCPHHCQLGSNIDWVVFVANPFLFHIFSLNVCFNNVLHIFGTLHPVLGYGLQCYCDVTLYPLKTWTTKPATWCHIPEDLNFSCTDVRNSNFRVLYDFYSMSNILAFLNVSINDQ
jgi:hypothetical protein